MKSTTKSELISKVTDKLKLSNGKAELVVEAIFQAMKDALIDGERIEIRGFGSFEMRSYKGYQGRNPKSGEHVEVQPKRLPFFKCGKGLAERLK